MARRRRRMRAIIGALVVLALAGVAAYVFSLAYHKSQSNAQDQKALAAKEKAAAGVQIVGIVSKVDAGSVTLRLPNGNLRRVFTTVKTRVANATSGSEADVRKGFRGLVSPKPNSPRTAQEILVLPAAARLGQPIAKVGLGTVWLRTKTGKLGPKYNYAGAKVDHGVITKRTALTSGVTVLMHAVTTTKPVRYVATDIVIVPSDSALIG
jgi:hypothetical protein